MHIVSVFENTPLQLARALDGSVQRFHFKDVVPGKKGFSALEGPITWLEKAGIVLKTKICNRAELPLEAFCRSNIFKLYVFDVGLLGCLLNLPQEAISSQDYGIAKGYQAESFVAEEMHALGQPLCAWSEVTSEIEFLRVVDGAIVPVEVKSGTRTRAKSLGEFIRRYAPRQAIRLSANPPRAQGVLRDYPLYMAGSLVP